jgi:hypothetical protein
MGLAEVLRVSRPACWIQSGVRRLPACRRREAMLRVASSLPQPQPRKSTMLVVMVTGNRNATTGRTVGALSRTRSRTGAPTSKPKSSSAASTLLAWQQTATRAAEPLLRRLLTRLSRRRVRRCSREGRAPSWPRGPLGWPLVRSTPRRVRRLRRARWPPASSRSHPQRFRSTSTADRCRRLVLLSWARLLGGHPRDLALLSPPSRFSPSPVSPPYKTHRFSSCRVA